MTSQVMGKLGPSTVIQLADEWSGKQLFRHLAYIPRFKVRHPT